METTTLIITVGALALFFALVAIVGLLTVVARLGGIRARTKADFDEAQPALLKTLGEMSSKLLDDHKRESEDAKKASEEHIRKTTKGLTEQFQSVVKAVASLNDQVADSKKMADTVWRALSTPGGAGHFAEIGLENTLKSFGLVPDRDFVRQYTIPGESEGRRLRPDAVVFLPGDAFLVIDSKASKFLLEIAQAEGTESEEEAYANLARTMNQHLKALAEKNYKSAILESSRKAGRGGAMRRLVNVMYLPNEGAVEKIAKADPGFVQKAVNLEIVVAGPTALAALIAFARVEIDLGRQAENQDRIVDASQHLLDSVAVTLGHVEHVGRGLKSAADGFSKLAGSINSRLLPRARKLVALGVRPSRSRDMSRNLSSFQIVESTPAEVIEGEAEEIPREIPREIPQEIPEAAALPEHDRSAD